MKKKDTFQFQIPEKLIDKIRETEKTPPKIPGFKSSNLMELIHLVCTRIIDTGYSQLKMKYLKKIVPTADQYIHFLLKEKIIQRDGQYIPKSKAYGYRINPKYQSKLISIQNNDAKLLRRIRSINSFSKSGGSLTKKWIQNFSINPAALTFAENNFINSKSLNYAIAAIHKIMNEEKFLKIDTTAGRLHTNITNLPKELRQFIIASKGQKLIANIDIKNSQPYFSTLIFTDPQKIAEYAKGKNLHMILKTLQAQLNEDVKQYINLVCEGKFYEYLVTEFDKRGLNFDRDQVKKSVMLILFDANCHMFKERKIFAELFPTVHATFNLIRGNSKGDHFTSFKRFSILLQAIEAHTVLNIIHRRIIKEHPDIITFTVHDSILTTSAPELIRDIMTEELTKFCGRKPILKIEKLINNETKDRRINRKKEKGKQ